MEIWTTDLILKLAGAALALVVGVWIGLGLPGLKSRDEVPRGRPSRYLHGTWLNRVFFGMPRPPRRFDSSRLLAPKRREEKGREDSEGDEDEEGAPIVRLRGRG